MTVLELVGRIERVCVVNIKQKGQFMIVQLLKRRILAPFPESQYPKILHYVVLLIGALIIVSGFLLIADMELTRQQMAVGCAIVLSLGLQCFTLAVLLKIAQKPFAKGA